MGSENKGKAIVPTPEIMDLPDEGMHSSHVEDNMASSSRSDIRAYLMGMGFSSSLIDRVIKEKGESDIELLLETLCGYSDVQKLNSQSSDSLDSLFGDEDDTETSTSIQPKEEPDILHAGGDNDGKRKSLLMMNFSTNAVNFALDKLGEDAPMNDLVDFIITAQIAENLEETNDIPHVDGGKNEDGNNEVLSVTMEKTKLLLEMGFSEKEVSSVIEKFGSDIPISELADSIFAEQIASNSVRGEEYSSTTVPINHSCFAKGNGSSGVDNIKAKVWGKMPKEENFDDFTDSAFEFQHNFFEESHKGKKPKLEYVDHSSSLHGSSWLDEKLSPNITRSEMLKASNSGLSKSTKTMLGKVVAKAPYFFYGNIANISGDCWKKISYYFYELEPEFVDTRLFSALNRKEGYVHNLPTSNRSHILPKSPMTIEDAIPHTKKWWKPWDKRKQLSFINSETSGISQICDRLQKMLIDSRGLPSSEQQREILHHCESLNLVWAGHNKLAPVDPEFLERILGFPTNHTQAAENSLPQRLESLKYCFQTDTLGYHLSVLKSIYPGGLTVLSVFSGVGGAEITLHRLGIRLKGVISVETSETNRRILRRWWDRSSQTGELVQIEDIRRLSNKKLDSLMEKFGSIDLVICNPCAPASKNPTTAEIGFDFFLFYEFVRVVQGVRSAIEKKR